jgi:hypothetical protein
MARGRFFQFSECSIFQITKNKHDEPQKEGEVFYKFMAVFQNSLTPFQNLCADKSIGFFKRQLNFKQRIKANGLRFGVRFTSYVTETGYVSKLSGVHMERQ